MNRWGSFPLLSAPHSLFSIWTDLKRCKKIPGAPTCSWGECVRLTGPSGLHRNSPQGLNISSIRVFDQIRDPEISITLPTPIINNPWEILHFISSILTLARCVSWILVMRNKGANYFVSLLLPFLPIFFLSSALFYRFSSVPLSYSSSSFLFSTRTKLLKYKRYDVK